MTFSFVLVEEEEEEGGEGRVLDGAEALMLLRDTMALEGLRHRGYQAVKFDALIPEVTLGNTNTSGQVTFEPDSSTAGSASSTDIIIAGAVVGTAMIVVVVSLVTVVTVVCTRRKK